VRAQIPIIIAAVLLLALTVTTIYYTTSTLTYTGVVKYENTESVTWEDLSNQLLSILISSLAAANTNASNKFTNTYWNRGSLDAVRESSSTITRTCVLADDESRNSCSSCGGSYGVIWICEWWGCYPLVTCTIALNSYNYDDFVCIGLCNANYNLSGVSQARYNWISALNYSTFSYTSALREAISSSIGNWSSIISSYGFTVYNTGNNPNINYTINVSSSPGDYASSCSTSTAKLRISLSLDVFSVTMGYRRVNYYIEAGYNTTFCMGLWLNDGILLPVYVSAYLDLNGDRSTYIVSPEQVMLILNSTVLKRLRFLNTSDGNVALKPYASYYMSNGTVLLYFKIPVTNDYINKTWEQVAVFWRSLLLSCIYCDDTFQPLTSINSITSGNTCGTTTPSVTLAYLIPGIIRVNINGLDVFNGVKIILKYYANTKPNNGDWLDSIPFDFYGDERASFPSFIQ